jgi:hypothetical protein
MRMLESQLNYNRVHASVYAHAASRGNTLMEYGITGALLIIVCIVGLQFLNSGLNKAVAMIRDDMQSRQKSAETMHALQVAHANGQSTGTLSAAEQALLQQSLGNKLQTTGANGSTELLANQVAATAALLLAEGKIDQSQYDVLMRLSNQGHKIAQIEATVAESLKMANGDVAAFENMTFTIDGQTYQGKRLAGQIGFGSLYPKDFNTTDIMTTGYTHAGSQLTTFLDLYKEAQASGALSDPAANDTVTSAATQIASIGEVVEDSVAQFTWGKVDGDADSILAFQASNASHMNSDKICETGSFQANGTLCQI